ncbi:retron system putative HNH endonuclease [Aeromonas veronii]|uniref:retron system putative HNH endonuclease n=1 Tax=Aeromonas veronii TaxID=654 RepID=UPI0030CCA2A5
MKKISKSLPPNPLTNFAAENPLASWDPDFRGHNQSRDYKDVRGLMLHDQGGLCGYCESKVIDQLEHKQRVEHFHDKSDQSDLNAHNWGLDWQNVFAVCVGGSDADKTIHPLPDNLSCDAHKGHLKGELNEAPEGYLLNPLTMPSSPCLFIFDKRTGELKANPATCADVDIADNRFATVQELVENTIRILNLNCSRLTAQRLEVLNAYNQAIKIAKIKDDKQCFAKLSERWFGSKWPAFFTTRRLLLGSHAESYLASIHYDG